MMLTVPGFCLINSKLIVSNVTNMEIDAYDQCFTAFFLLYINAGSEEDRFSDSLSAAAIFFVSIVTYAIFVVCTIGQITQLLDINCLTLKQKKA